jgi:hypothetical protein
MFLKRSSFLVGSSLLLYCGVSFNILCFKKHNAARNALNLCVNCVSENSCVNCNCVTRLFKKLAVEIETSL